MYRISTKGSLRVGGDTVLAGTAYGKVRARQMNAVKGKSSSVHHASRNLRLSEVPQAGEIINGMDDNEARAIAEKRIAKQRVQELQATIKVTLMISSIKFNKVS